MLWTNAVYKIVERHMYFIVFFKQNENNEL